MPLDLIYEQKAGRSALSQITQFNIDAQKEFNVSVSGALLTMNLFGGRERSCKLYDFYSMSLLYSFGWVGDKYVANVDNYIKPQEILLSLLLIISIILVGFVRLLQFTQNHNLSFFVCQAHTNTILSCSTFL